MLQNISKVFYQHFLKTCNCHLWYEIPPLTACFQAEEQNELTFRFLNLRFLVTAVQSQMEIFAETTLLNTSLDFFKRFKNIVSLNTVSLY